MAVEELNAAGGVLGRPVELVEREGIAAAGGMISSDIGAALSREADTLRGPVFFTRAGAHTILRRSSRYTFRTGLVASPMYVQASAALLQYAKYTRVGVIIADYAWGRSYMQWLERYVRSIPGMQIQIEIAPVTASDFTPYLRRLLGFNPQFLDVGDDNAFSSYVIVKMVADAARRANTTDPQRIADLIRRGRFTQPEYGWPLFFTEWGEMREARPILFSIQQGDQLGGICPGSGWKQKFEFRVQRLEPYVPEE